MKQKRVDVVVVGGGNAAMSAAMAAKERGREVLVLEKAPKAWRGGNSHFTGGAFRFAFDSTDDLRALIPDVKDDEFQNYDIDPYTGDQYFDDLVTVTEGLTDPDLADYLVSNSYDTMRWMQQQGMRFALLLRRQSYVVNGRTKFWGGLILEAVGGGAGLIERWYELAESQGLEVWYDAEAYELMTENVRQVKGVRVLQQGEPVEVLAESVILAAGGFEANAAMRAQYLGKDWDLALVRGTPYNTGDAIRMALAVGAEPYGHWSGSHAVQWDANAPRYGDREVGDGFQKHSYPLGIIVNREGRRFVDEGADFRNYTYAKYGREVMKQPGRIAFQIFDAATLPLLRDEYRIRQITRAEANTLDELARKLGIEDTEQFVRTVQEFNQAVDRSTIFDPAVKDGRAARGITPPKSNWAVAIEKPPFVGFAVTCGITFTFGGLHINDDGQVLDTRGEPIPGLYAAGELVGGLFYHNYAGGSGLMAGSVFGRLAGSRA
ncbi:FAD-dependent tricarballylate dehydrogenase TcuA [Sulfobacillus harzensis]|uniref:FAD-dependent tricarballylate dehydrogenase TcuA n=1 Tax=Sulfobacillus harzensis TaxID=2729629 RepID=A0A7Y0L4U1_9FIRM|nr:FAD-dependent tricarballylate dehydrogenase TcuA [Sulfobacillus harzensis]NMP23322.1 FAD-dependent tricarballylate dehydrogenase TcuA [Sulfobacillus harzensis]